MPQARTERRYCHRVLTWIRALARPTTSKTLAGVDVASFQGAPSDWAAPAGNFTWAAVKFTELEPKGTEYVNPDAAADWAWLQQHGKGRVAYLFGHPSTDATATVDLFLAQLNAAGLRNSDGVAVDLEVSDGLAPAEVAAWGKSVLTLLGRRLDRKPLLYTFRDFAAAGNCAGLGGSPLWIADPSSPAGKPQVPGPWKSWAIHQYEISGAIDRDVANYATLAVMQAALGRPAKVPPPPIPTPPQEPPLQHLGGNVSGISSARWPDGEIAVAGLGTDSFVYVILSNGNAWGNWKKVSPTQAKNAPSLVSFDNNNGRLFYIEESGAVVELSTNDRGTTWE